MDAGTLSPGRYSREPDCATLRPENDKAGRLGYLGTVRSLASNNRSHVAGYSHVQTVGLEQMRSHFARLVRSHEAEVAEPRKDFRAELQHAPLPSVTLSSAAVEVSVTVRAQPKHTYLVFGATDTPLHMQIGRSTATIPVGRLGIVPPGVPYRLYLPRGGCRTLMLEIEPGFLDAVIAEESRADVSRPVRFAGSEDEQGERHFVELLKYIRDELAQGAPQCRDPRYVARLEELLVSALVHARRHNYSGELDAAGRTLEPRFVRRAVDFIHAHAGEQLSLKEMAEVAAVSPRTLLRGFRKYKDCAPASYLRSVRLDRSHEELLAATPEDLSVTSVAAKWGFSNAGRFARCYRERFGENPAETLKRRS